MVKICSELQKMKYSSKSIDFKMEKINVNGGITTDFSVEL